MLDRSQLPYLVQLLDDESPALREHIVQQLLSFGESLEEELRPYESSMTEEQRNLLRAVLSEHRRAAALREAWLQWRRLACPYEQLEAAFEVLAQYQYGWTPPVSLRETLDALADEFRDSDRPQDALGLSRFLFITKRIRGNANDYHNPLNSNLIHVAEEKRGIPISLACIFMLVGHRLGIRIEGCNVPGHFLARADVKGEQVLFDCFNRGRVLTAKERAQLREPLPPNLLPLLEEAPAPEAIVVRVLRNLIASYERANDHEKCALVRELLRDVVEDVHDAPSAGL